MHRAARLPVAEWTPCARFRPRMAHRRKISASESVPLAGGSARRSARTRLRNAGVGAALEERTLPVGRRRQRWQRSRPTRTLSSGVDHVRTVSAGEQWQRGQSLGGDRPGQPEQDGGGLGSRAPRPSRTCSSARTAVTPDLEVQGVLDERRGKLARGTGDGSLGDQRPQGDFTSTTAGIILAQATDASVGFDNNGNFYVADESVPQPVLRASASSRPERFSFLNNTTPNQTLSDNVAYRWFGRSPGRSGTSPFSRPTATRRRPTVRPIRRRRSRRSAAGPLAPSTSWRRPTRTPPHRSTRTAISIS